MTPVDHLLALVLIGVLPVFAARAGAQLARQIDAVDTGARLRLYASTMTLQWTLTLALAGLWHWQERSFASLGLVRPAGAALWIAVALCAITIISLAIQVRTALASVAARASVRADLERSPGTRAVVPASAREFQVFAAMSVTAGTCEEVLYRGYLLWYLTALLPFGAAIAVAVAMFGIGHAYQGLRGVLLTGLGGGIALAIYMWTGSLAAPVFIHATFNLANGFIIYRARQEDATPAPDRVAGGSVDLVI